MPLFLGELIQKSKRVDSGLLYLNLLMKRGVSRSRLCFCEGYKSDERKLKEEL